jgi:hypothetical protein
MKEGRKEDNAERNEERKDDGRKMKGGRKEGR